MRVRSWKRSADSLSVVLRYTVAMLVHKAECALRFGKTLFCGLAIPDGSLSVVLRYTVAREVSQILKAHPASKPERLNSWS
jgi:hypothetical protein